MKKTSDIPLITGFSLIELMIAVFIIGVLATITVPAYLHHVHRSRRYDAISQLQHMQTMQARYRANHTTYATLIELGTATSSDYYSYAVSNVSGTAYTLTATAKPSTSQNDDTEDGTACTPLTLDQSNTKTPSICWPK